MLPDLISSTITTRNSSISSTVLSCTDVAIDKFKIHTLKSKNPERTCKWLNEQTSSRRQTLCNDTNISNASTYCPHVCAGKCKCKDTNQLFQDSFHHNQTCLSIATTKKWYNVRKNYCSQKNERMVHCPDTCLGWCNTSDDYVEIDKDDKPVNKICKDRTSTFLYYGNKKNCEWVRKWPSTRCKYHKINQYCPQTCGECETMSPTRSPITQCIDDPNEFLYDNRKMRKCSWIELHRNKRCSKSGVLDSCPLTCGVCTPQTRHPTGSPTISHMPSSSPTQIPMDIQTCYDHMSRLHEGKQEIMTSRTWYENTLWIDRDRHSWFRKRQPFEPIVGDTTVIAGILYSFSHEKLKLSVFFPPLYPRESKEAVLIVKGITSSTSIIRKCSITHHIWHCLFVIESLSEQDSYSYQVQYRPDISRSGNNLIHKKNKEKENTHSSDSKNVIYIYEGTIPKPQKYPRIAALGCIGRDDTMHKTELVDSVLSTSPTMVVLTGDQTYFHWNLGYGFLETIYTINKITRNIPTIVLMDDHDYGQGSLKGAGSEEEDSGAGFERPTCLINSIEQLMMSHNPDPARVTVLLNGISAKYTTYSHGKLEFAITEARKFKHFSNYPKKDSILGEEQEEWLKEWCLHNSDKIKVVLSVTPFANLVTHMSRINEGFLTEGNNDRDSNGSPSTARLRAMKIFQGCSPLIISGDQHLGIVATYDNYGITECVTPAVLNSIFWRLNYNVPGGSYHDSYDNQYTLHNVWNVHPNVTSTYKRPSDTVFTDKDTKNARGDGFLTVDFDGNNAICSMHEYWFGDNVKWAVKFPTGGKIKSVCNDNDSVIFYDNKLRPRKCKWVRSKRTSRRCNLTGASRACKLTCGTCSRKLLHLD